MEAINIDVVRDQLTNKRQEVLEGVSRARELGSSQGDTGAPDIADRATSAISREFSFSLSENENQLLRLIDEALARIDNGRFGKCVQCGDAIEQPRLAAIPWARHCIACQELQDRGEF